MPGPKTRLTHRMKKYAHLVHEGVPPFRAYQQAGYAYSTWEPYTILRKPKFQNYLRKLEERAMRKHDITVEKVLTDLESAKELAMLKEQCSAAINATMAQAKVVGLIVDKIEKKDVSDMDMKELIASVRDELGDQADTVIKALGLEERPKEADPEWTDFPTTGTVQ